MHASSVVLSSAWNAPLGRCSMCVTSGASADHEGALCTHSECKYLKLLLLCVLQAHGGGHVLQGRQAAKSGIDATHGQAKAGADQAADTAASQVCGACLNMQTFRLQGFLPLKAAQLIAFLHACQM